MSSRSRPPVHGTSSRDFIAGVGAGDTDRDGNVDVLVAAGRGRLGFFPGRGDGTFWPQEEVVLPRDDTVAAVLLRDLDKDGWEDLLVSYFGDYPPGAGVLAFHWGVEEGFVDLDSPSTGPGGPVVRLDTIEGVRRSFTRGDADRDGRVGITDAVVVLEQLFSGRRMVCGDASDVDDSGYIEIPDALYLIGFLFLGSPAPPHPFPAPGGDLTADTRFPFVQGTGSDLGCSYETFHPLLFAPCFPDEDQSQCRHPLRQILDVSVE